MKKYTFQYSPKDKKYRIKVSGFFGASTIKAFPGSEYTQAMEYLKQLAARNRPSMITTLDNQGNVKHQWEYKEFKRKSYETRKRKPEL